LLHPTASTAAPFFLSFDPHTAVPPDPQLLPAPRKHFLLLLSVAVRLHQQQPATPGETHTCSSSSQQATSPSPSTSAHRPAAPWSSDRPLEEEDDRRKLICSEADPTVTDPKEPDLRKTKPKQSVACVFLCFAGSGVPHSRQGRAEKEKAGQICPFPASAAAREATRRQERWRVGTRAASVPARISAVPEALPLQFLEF